MGSPTCWVYRAYDDAGRLIYVGITAQLGGRLWSHGNTSAWAALVDTIKVERHPSRAAARLRELELIREHEPRFNREANPGAGRWQRYEAAMLRSEIARVESEVERLRERSQREAERTRRDRESWEQLRQGWAEFDECVRTAAASAVAEQETAKLDETLDQIRRRNLPVATFIWLRLRREHKRRRRTR